MADTQLIKMRKTELAALVEDTIRKLEDQLEKARTSLSGMESKQEEADKLLKKSQTRLASTNQAFKAIVEKRDSANSLIEEIQGQVNSANASLSTMQNNQNSVSELSTEVEEKYRYIKNQMEEVESERAEIGSQLVKVQGIREEIEEIVASAKEEIASNTEEMERLLKTIEDLLPGAATTGLAKNYYDAQQNRVVWPYWCGFVGSLLAVTAGYYFLFLDLLTGKDALEWWHAFIRATIGIPLLWIAWYCQRSLSQINRIKEEYQHKERMMKMYVGFSKEVEDLSDLDNSNPLIELIHTVMDTIRRNPAEVLHPTETILDSILARGDKQESEE